jgi:hypothetical protein
MGFSTMIFDIIEAGLYSDHPRIQLHAQDLDLEICTRNVPAPIGVKASRVDAHTDPAMRFTPKFFVR